MDVKHVLLVGASALLLAACARVGKEYTERLNARQQAYAAVAGAPVNKFHYFSLWSWEPLSDDQLAVYTRSNEAWLLDLDGKCRNLQFTNHIALTSSVSEVSVKFDRVLTGPPDPPCFIKQIRPVDVARLQSPQQGKPREVEEAPRPAK
ncbi:DUF6491 family protein [Dyella soli]|uniref:Lipoprotein n=1 Tax=Dyella soli TaxID=522319 RepID=A0A4R0YLK7_9GAMM|nr:DUF6491 family protein [Dyella soli]TCI07205.1 hypothetical protein EZM97_31895 [Dyella soli]